MSSLSDCEQERERRRFVDVSNEASDGMSETGDGTRFHECALPLRLSLVLLTACSIPSVPGSGNVMLLAKTMTLFSLPNHTNMFRI